jgi:multidrug efflux pump subunit AcrA (membrane-fusion protein)
MNLMGKIFTFLIFLLSVVFLVIAIMVGASDREWKSAAAAQKTKAQAATRNIDLLKGETEILKTTLAAEKASRAQQLAHLQSQLKLAQAELAQKSAELNKRLQIAEDLLREFKEANTRLAAQDKELAMIRTNNTQLVEDIASQFRENRVFEETVFEQTSTLKQLEQKNQDMAATLAKADKALKIRGINPNDPTEAIPPKVEAVVAAVGQSGEKFLIMAGQDDGLRKGHELDIYRSNRYVGTGKVIEAENNQSVLQVVKGLMNDIVREGDNVSTKLF